MKVTASKKMQVLPKGGRGIDTAHQKYSIVSYGSFLEEDYVGTSLGRRGGKDMVDFHQVLYPQQKNTYE